MLWIKVHKLYWRCSYRIYYYVASYIDNARQYVHWWLCFVDRVRLTNGSSPNVGRVEIYTPSSGDLQTGGWGTVCDDNWDILDARVVCYQLGYLDAVAAPLSAHYGQGTGPIWLDNLQCLGTESNLYTCPHREIGEYDCDHSEDASAECLGIAT